mmetsp:Transcript_367/g.626  ORF Transcript_367/g.626 Transcript_367/m.626 type:complete len:162 (+) Transcript_367:2835-3320(+)
MARTPSSNVLKVVIFYLTLFIMGKLPHLCVVTATVPSILLNNKKLRGKANVHGTNYGHLRRIANPSPSSLLQPRLMAPTRMARRMNTADTPSPTFSPSSSPTLSCDNDSAMFQLSLTTEVGRSSIQTANLSLMLKLALLKVTRTTASKNACQKTAASFSQF